MFMIGAGMGAVSVLSMDADAGASSTQQAQHPGHMQNSIAQWSDLDADLLLMMFLPGLIFKEAVEVPFNLFVRSSGKKETLRMCTQFLCVVSSEEFL